MVNGKPDTTMITARNRATVQPLLDMIADKLAARWAQAAMRPQHA